MPNRILFAQIPAWLRQSIFVMYETWRTLKTGVNITEIKTEDRSEGKIKNALIKYRRRLLPDAPTLIAWFTGAFDVICLYAVNSAASRQKKGKIKYNILYNLLPFCDSFAIHFWFHANSLHENSVAFLNSRAHILLMALDVVDYLV